MGGLTKKDDVFPPDWANCPWMAKNEILYGPNINELKDINKLKLVSNVGH
jgi:hypothetical protein